MRATGAYEYTATVPAANYARTTRVGGHRLPRQDPVTFPAPAQKPLPGTIPTAHPGNSTSLRRRYRSLFDPRPTPTAGLHSDWRRRTTGAFHLGCRGHGEASLSYGVAGGLERIGPAGVHRVARDQEPDRRSARDHRQCQGGPLAATRPWIPPGSPPDSDGGRWDQLESGGVGGQRLERADGPLTNFTVAVACCCRRDFRRMELLVGPRKDEADEGTVPGWSIWSGCSYRCAGSTPLLSSRRSDTAWRWSGSTWSSAATAP